MITIPLSPIPLALANMLKAHIADVKAGKAKNTVLSYAEARKRSGAQFALIGIGLQLEPIVVALHERGLPAGFTLFTMGTTPKNRVEREKFYDGFARFGISERNAPAHRKAALDFDWSAVEFVPAQLTV
jgi:hypothetical protein